MDSQGNEIISQLHNYKCGRVSIILNARKVLGDFPGGAVVKNPPANAGETGSIPSPGRSHVPRSG